MTEPATQPTHPPGEGAEGGRSRAAALPPEERRAEIAAATVPLLEMYGSAVTTRQIAEAAGLAEGTLFRVFPDKEEIIQAALETVFDPAPLESALRAIDLSQPLERRLERAVELMYERVARIWQIMAAVGRSRMTQRPRPSTLGTLVALFEPDRHRLRRPPEQAAQLLRGLVVASTHPALAADAALPPAEIVSLLLDGIRLPGGDGADGDAGADQGRGAGEGQPC